MSLLIYIVLGCIRNGNFTGKLLRFWENTKNCKWLKKNSKPNGAMSKEWIYNAVKSSSWKRR